MRETSRIIAEQPSEQTLRLYDDFLALTSVDRLQKILARYELFKLAVDVPGDVVECGVFRGSGIYTWAKLLRIFKPYAPTRLIGFDFFETDRNAAFARPEDARVLEAHDPAFADRQAVLRNLAALGCTNVELVAGDVAQTTRAYAAQHLGFRIALLYLDLDNYEGTLASLTSLFPLVSRGGVVAFDEYACRGYGESDAVDAYLRGRGLKLRSLPWANTPTAYLVKDEPA